MLQSAYHAKEGTAMKSHDAIRRMVQASLLTALAVILSIWPKFPILPAVSWMKFEFSDIPVLLGGSVPNRRRKHRHG